MNKLLALFTFSILLLVPLVAQDAFAVTKTYVGVSGGDWELGTNWSPLGVPNPIDDVIIDIGDINVIINSAVTVGPSGSITLSPTSINNNLFVNGPSGSLTIFGTFTMNDNDDDLIITSGISTVTVQCSGVVTLGNGMLFVNQITSTLINHGLITGTQPGGIFFSDNNIIILGLVQNSGTLPTAVIVVNPGTLQTIPSICAIGGELLDINYVSLFIGAIGVNPVITGLVAITMGGVAAQAVWFVHRRRKSIKS